MKHKFTKAEYDNDSIFSGTLSLSAAPAPSATPSAANVRRKSSQVWRDEDIRGLGG